MVYSGKYIIKHPHKYDGDHTKVVYRSMWEKYVFKWCENNDEVVSWSSEEIVIPYFYDLDNKYHRYYPDLKIKFNTGKVAMIEIKPYVQTKTPAFPGRKTKRYMNESFAYIKNVNKWKAAENFCADRKWVFWIWTERELTNMGIMPKSTKGLKPFPKKRLIKNNKRKVLA